jgi:hypothetical protein
VLTTEGLLSPVFYDIAKRLTIVAEEFHSGPEVEAASQSLQDSTFMPPILAYPQPGEKFALDTNTVFE